MIFDILLIGISFGVGRAWPHLKRAAKMFS